ATGVGGGGLVGGAPTSKTAGAAGAVTAVKVPDKAENFRLVDQNSKAHELFYYKNSPAIVIISQQNGSQNIRDAAPAIQALKNTFASKDVPVMLLNSSTSDNRDSVAAEMKTAGLDLPGLLDDSQIIGESLGVTRWV